MTKPTASDYDLARALMDRIERDGAVHLDSLAAVCMTHRVVERAGKAETSRPVGFGWDFGTLEKNEVWREEWLQIVVGPVGKVGPVGVTGIDEGDRLKVYVMDRNGEEEVSE